MRFLLFESFVRNFKTNDFEKEIKMYRHLAIDFQKRYLKEFNIIFYESKSTNSVYIKLYTKDEIPVVTFRISDHRASDNWTRENADRWDLSIKSDFLKNYKIMSDVIKKYVGFQPKAKTPHFYKIAI